MQFCRSLWYQFLFSPPIVWFIDWLDRSKQAKSPLGERGERLAGRYLLTQGWIILERHYRDKFGEIDLIGVDGRTVVFVEVKTRSDDQSDPTDAVDEEKQKRITRTAKGYLKWHHLTESRCRFDVIAILWPTLVEANCDTGRSSNATKTGSKKTPKLKHYRSAFEAHGDFQLY